MSLAALSLLFVLDLTSEALRGSLGSLLITSKYWPLPSCWPKMLMKFLSPFLWTCLLLITSYLKFFCSDRVLAVASYPDSR